MKADAPSSALRSARRAAFIAAVLGYLTAAGVLVLAILRSTSSTAAIGFFYIPALALAPALVAGTIAGSGAYAWRRLAAPRRRFDLRLIVALLLFFALSTGVVVHAAGRLRVAWAVCEVAEMDREALHEYLVRGALQDDRFVLGAMAMNPSADAALLDAVARIDDPSLHAKLVTVYPLLGENRKGLAVMRLVARHEATSAGTLRHLASSADDYVAADVAGHPRTPADVLSGLAQRGEDLIEWGLARNPGAPAALLERLAQSEDRYTRSAAAGNPSLPTAALERLALDEVWHVRRDVAGNPVTPTQLLARLAADSDDRVVRMAEAALSRR